MPASQNHAVLPDADRTLHYRAVPSVDKQPGRPAVWVVPVPGPDPGAPLEGVPRVEAAAGGSVGAGEKVDWGWEDRWKIRDLLAAGRCSRAVLDFRSSTDVGRRMSAEEDGAMSAVSELEVGEWMEQRGARAG
jgi:hypothetical protein